VLKDNVKVKLDKTVNVKVWSNMTLKILPMLPLDKSAVILLPSIPNVTLVEINLKLTQKPIA